MAVVKPIVLNLVTGQFDRLQAGDTVSGAGGAAVITSTDTFDFGNDNNFVTKTILNANLTNANINSFAVVNLETTATSLDDFTLNGVTFNIENIVDGVSFDIRANAVNNANGIYSINYFITYQ